MASLDDIYENGANAHRYSNYVALCCPFHNDTHPSLFAYADGFHCAACNETGTLDKLYDKLKYGTVSHTVDPWRSPWRRWLSDGKTYGQLAAEAHQTLLDFPGQGVYLRKRGLESAIGRLKIGYLDGHYIFPIFDPDRNVIGLVARSGETLQNETGVRYITPKGQAPMLYAPSWKRIRKADYVYFPFGILDAITLWMMGEPVITWSNGKHPDPMALEPIRKRIVLIPDLGEEGDAAKVSKYLGWRGSVKRLDYPAHTKDPNDVYRMFGASVLFDLLQ